MILSSYNRHIYTKIKVERGETMVTKTRSVFLYGNPTIIKRNKLQNLQQIYTNIVNQYIEELLHDSVFYLDLFNNNKQSSLIRNHEKQTRTRHDLGSAYGQNMIDHAVTECHNHMTRIKNKLYGWCVNNEPELLPFVSFISLLHISIVGGDEIQTIQNLIVYENNKKKPSKTKIEDYQTLLKTLQSYTKEERNDKKEMVKVLFYEKLNTWKRPNLQQTPIQLDARVSKMNLSEHITFDFVVEIKVPGQKEYVSFLVNGSKNTKRRLSQYKTGSMKIEYKNGNVRVIVPFEKKVEVYKSKQVLAGDIGITDLITTNTKQHYGSFKQMIQEYENLVEIKTGRRSSLRNLRKKYRKELKKCQNPIQQEWYRMKIRNISRMLEGKRKLQKQQNKYHHMVNVQVNLAAKSFVKEAKQGNYHVGLEDLEIKEFNRGKKSNKRDSSWIRGQLMKKIISLCEWNGVPVTLVDPAYTSQCCSKCHHIDANSRKNKVFTCTVCKYTTDADQNASINIAERVFDRAFHEIVERYQHQQKKRHTAIKEYYKKKHQEKQKQLTAA